MSKYDIQPYFECQNRILNVKIRYSASVLMSKWDFECENTTFGLRSNVKIGFLMSRYDIFGPISNVKIGFRPHF